MTKGTKEAEAFFGPDAEGILNVDRASNYKALTAVKQGTLLLAFCWTHTRRDFLDAVRSDPEQQDWAEPWLQRFGELFHLNKPRVAAWKKDPRGPEFAEQDAVLRARIEDFRIARDEELKQEKLPADSQKDSHQFGQPLGRSDGLRRPSGCADGQQRSRTSIAWPGDGA